MICASNVIPRSELICRHANYAIKLKADSEVSYSTDIQGIFA